MLDKSALSEEEHVHGQESSGFSKLKAFIKQQNEPEDLIMPADLLPTLETELRKHFLNQFFPLQMKWATSTVSDVSYIDRKYNDDQTLKSEQLKAVEALLKHCLTTSMKCPEWEEDTKAFTHDREE